MKKTSPRRAVACILLAAILLLMSACTQTQDTQLEKTANYLQAQISEPAFSSIGGEWLVFGLARSDVKVSERYYEAYYKNAENYVREKNGVLHDKKYTEYSRLVLALTAIGKDPADVAGYNMLQPLGDFQAVTQQGINGAIFALLALDSGGSISMRKKGTH